jgi:HK97 gp10 family phage protein
MADVVLRINGLEGLLKKLNNAPAIIKSKGNDAINATLLVLESASKPLTPIDTGRLRSSYSTVPSSNLSGVLWVNAGYAGFVHGGTKWMKARPFLKWGIEASQVTIDKIWQKLAESIVNAFAQ